MPDFVLTLSYQLFENFLKEFHKSDLSKGKRSHSLLSKLDYLSSEKHSMAYKKRYTITENILQTCHTSLGEA